jgi:NADPH:quinone reductase-like Zn-dependent oxidoreductase
MKAAAYTSYGAPDTIRIEELAKPAPNAQQVLIRVRAAGVNPLDWRLARGKPYLLRLLFGLRKPRFGPGRDVAGEVESIGAEVTRFKPGDAVFGACYGAFAEYACAKESSLALKPQRVTFEQAASLPVAGSTALQGLRDCVNVRAGQRVLVNGAAGGVGTLAVQLARSFGAHVTGVCSTRNVELVRSIGAQRVIDYTSQDFTRDTTRYDVIYDCVANRALRDCARVLTPQGTCVIAGAPHAMSTAGLLWYPIAPRIASLRGPQKFRTFLAKMRSDDLGLLAELVESGTLTPVIDRCLPLAETAEAIAYVERGHAKGKVVIIPDGAPL